MSEFFAALFIIVFVLALIYVVKKLLDSEKWDLKYKKFLIIPVRNNMPNIAKAIKAAYWDNDFNASSRRGILVYLIEEPDERCRACLDEICEELEGIKVVERNKLEDYISSTV